MIEEADESVFWMEVLIGAEIVKPTDIQALMNEAKEILMVLSSARKNDIGKEQIERLNLLT